MSDLLNKITKAGREIDSALESGDYPLAAIHAETQLIWLNELAAKKTQTLLKTKFC